jgi:predicted ester cyclase
MSTTDENKTLARRFFLEYFNEKQQHILGELFAPPTTLHYRGQDHIHTVDEWNTILGMWMTAYPDLHYTIDDMIAEGDKVLVRTTYSGTHLGDFWDIAPTGKAMRATEMLLVRIADGRIVEAWEEYDEIGHRWQLGWDLAPRPGDL